MKKILKLSVVTGIAMVLLTCSINSYNTKNYKKGAFQEIGTRSFNTNLNAKNHPDIVSFFESENPLKVPTESVQATQSADGASSITLDTNSNALVPQLKAITEPINKPETVELLDWWTQAKNAFSIGADAIVVDVNTGTTFKIKRTMGDNHADCEALTTKDTEIIKNLWGGFSWDVRPINILINGRILAASMGGMPHAGIDSAPALATVNNRSGDFGSGQNLDIIKGNGMNGHFDVHFLKSTRHKDNKMDPRHQAAAKIAAKK